jgi:thiamine biosynthesis lipoprotein ApbE
MFKTIACGLLWASTLGLAACDSKSEDKTQEAQQHAEKAQDKASDAAKEQEKAADAHAEAKEAKAEEDKTFVPTSQVPEANQTPAKN